MVWKLQNYYVTQILREIKVLTMICFPLFSKVGNTDTQLPLMQEDYCF